MSSNKSYPLMYSCIANNQGRRSCQRIITYDIYFGQLDPPEPAVVMHALLRNQVKKVYHSCMDSYSVSQRDALGHLLFVFF